MTAALDRRARRRELTTVWLSAGGFFTLVALVVAMSGREPGSPIWKTAASFGLMALFVWVMTGYYLIVSLIGVDDPDRANRIHWTVAATGFTFAAVKNQQTEQMLHSQQRAEEQRLAQAHADQQARLLREALQRHEAR